MSANFFNSFFVSIWPWWAGGMALGLTVPLFYYLFNTALGVSTGYGNILKSVLRNTNLKWLRSDEFSDKCSWRLFFMSGILTGGLISGILSGGSLHAISMIDFTGFLDMPLLLAACFLFTGGVMLGLGSRIAGGCTSGHSIRGIAQLDISSILVTIIFLISAAAASNIIKIVYQLNIK